MALIVEDGTGKADADAFVSVADCDAYHAALGNSAWTGDDATIKEPAIRRATQYISSLNYEGARTHGRDQALSWPRTGTDDAEGTPIGSDVVPQEVVDATCEAALFELQNPNALSSPVVTPGQITKREKVGEIEVEYANPLAGGAGAQQPTLISVQKMLAPYLDTSQTASTRHLLRA